jgi:antitoxin component YwqK of YwqJK toxin-antitoxin module
MQGEYEDGVQQGIWTYWDRNGIVERQVHFANDEEIDARTSPPWFRSLELR